MSDAFEERDPGERASLWQRITRRPSFKLVLVLGLLLSMTALGGKAAWSACDPAMALAASCWVDEYGNFAADVVDPWGNRLVDVPDEDRTTWPPAYSKGPNGIDEQKGGDDVLVLPQDDLGFIIHWNLVELAGTALAVLAILGTLAWVTPRAPSIGHEVFRSTLVALVPYGVALLLLDLVFNHPEVPALLGGVRAVVPPVPSVLGSLFLFLVLASCLLRLLDRGADGEQATPQ